MNKFVYILASSLLLCVSCDRFDFFKNPRSIEDVKQRYTPKDALEKLQRGNKNFQKNFLENSKNLHSRRLEVSSTQSPFAIVVGCSDSRVPPEIIFDQNLGDLFVVRVAGAVVGPVELDSIEYAAKYLGASVILVLGHENCGAIKAVKEGQTKDIEEIASLINQAVPDIKKLSVEDATEKNVSYFVNFLEKTPLIQKMISDDRMLVVGGYYHFQDGKVEFFQKSEF